MNLLGWSFINSLHSPQLRAQFPQSSLHLIILVLSFFPQCWEKKYRYGCGDIDSPHHHLLARLYPCSCLVGRRRNTSPSVSLPLTKGHNHCLLWFCKHFTALLGAGLRLPMYFLWPLNNYQSVEAGSWIADAKFIFLAGGKGLCLSLPALCVADGQLLPQIAQAVFGCLSCAPKATPPGFT